MRKSLAVILVLMVYVSMLGQTNIRANNGVFTGNVTVGGALGVKGSNPWYDVCQNGFACDGLTSDTPAFNSLITSACSAGGGMLWIPPSKTVRLGSAPNHIPCGLTIVGAWSKGSAFGFGSFIKCDYAESTATNGCLWWDGANAVTQGNGGGVIGVNIQKGDGFTGGAAIKMSATSCTVRAGNGHFESVKVSSNTGTFNYVVYLDGSACTTAGTQGLRDVYMSDMELFGSITQSVFLNNCTHCQFIHVTTSLGAGSNADFVVTGASGATASSTDVAIVATEISGSLIYDFANTTRCAACNVTGAFSSTVNTTVSSFEGMAGSYSLVNGVALTAYDTSAVASQNGMLSATIRASQALVAGAAFPSNLAIGDIVSSSATTSGNFKLGSDGNMIIRRNNGGGSGTNLAITFDAFSTTPFNFENTNGFSTTRKITSSIATGTAPFSIASTTNTPNLNASILTGSGTGATLAGTGACATITAQAGGSIAGRATCTGTTGASTLTITPGITAPTGWVCTVYDQTTRANLLQQTSNTATTCTLTATSLTSSDVFVFTAVAF